MADATWEFYIDWDNDGTVASGAFETGENVTSYVLGIRQAPSWSFGRDTARSLAQAKPGEVTLKLNNADKRFSPDYGSSPLAGNLGPGKPVLIRAIFNSTTYNMFWGYIDGYEIDPHREEQSVELTCTDALGSFSDKLITTPLYSGIQTGTAIGYILDAVGWPGGKRDIDTGATTIRWWWADQDDALEAIEAVVKSEGPSALAYVDPATGSFVFRDRSHRFLLSASTTSQATFNSTDAAAEPHFSAPASYDVGFKDLCNDVMFTVQERDPIDLGEVWSTEESFVIAASSTRVFNISTEDPFFGAVTPVSGTDYSVLTGSVSSVTLSRTSGASAVITLTAGAGGATVDGLVLRAYSVPVQREYVITSSDSTSQGKYGLKSWTEDVPPWCGRNDAQAIADFIIGQRKDRLPVFEITVNNGNDTRRAQQLTRKLSDRITIVEDNTASNHAYYVEKIGHDVGQVGDDYRCTFAAERVREQDDPSTIFILDSSASGHRLDSGKLAT